MGEIISHFVQNTHPILVAVIALFAFAILAAILGPKDCGIGARIWICAGGCLVLFAVVVVAGTLLYGLGLAIQGIF